MSNIDGFPDEAEFTKRTASWRRLFKFKEVVVVGNSSTSKQTVAKKLNISSKTENENDKALRDLQNRETMVINSCDVTFEKMCSSGPSTEVKTGVEPVWKDPAIKHGARLGYPSDENVALGKNAESPEEGLQSSPPLIQGELTECHGDDPNSGDTMQIRRCDSKEFGYDYNDENLYQSARLCKSAPNLTTIGIDCKRGHCEACEKEELDEHKEYILKNLYFDVHGHHVNKEYDDEHLDGSTYTQGNILDEQVGYFQVNDSDAPQPLVTPIDITRASMIYRERRIPDNLVTCNPMSACLRDRFLTIFERLMLLLTRRTTGRLPRYIRRDSTVPSASRTTRRFGFANINLFKRRMHKQLSSSTNVLTVTSSSDSNSSYETDGTAVEQSNTVDECSISRHSSLYADNLRLHGVITLQKRLITLLRRQVNNNSRTRYIPTYTYIKQNKNKIIVH
ncbi:hypothetical protein BaOVIS_015930 [Babesia ovis]|uniref:Uncharacterized protein n=1 Tax=Babesia ovis TaxID=5869 RepID=A0A9W5TE39_BABOV|nr:hypothetical protein BaOVIS_015930 [Babesia ovis]